MSDNFQWQTDDDVWEESWEPNNLKQESGLPQKQKQYWPAFIGVVVIGFIMFIWVVYQRASEQVETVTEDRSADVLASLELIQQASETQDHELFVSLLSGRDPDWTGEQEQLLREAKLLDRAHFGLTLLSAEPVQTDVTLAADLLSATVGADYRYQTVTGDEIVLRQTAVYRPSADQRWLLAPPEDAFWGAYVTRSGGKLELTYDKRDEEWVNRLSPDLQTRIDATCQQLELNCEAVEVRLSLSHQLHTLLNTGDLPVYYEPDRITLPSPTLFGTPTDEASYTFLRDFYGAWVVTHVVKQATGYECCKHGLFYHVVMQKLLDDLGIKTWHVPPEMYRHLLTHSFDPSQLDGYWQRTMTTVSVDQAGVFALLDFLFEQNPNGVDSLALLISLQNSGPYSRWLTAVAPDGIDTDAFRAHLLTKAQSSTPENLPNYQLRAGCMSSGQLNYASLSLPDLTWQTEQSIGDNPYIQLPSSLPDSFLTYESGNPAIQLNTPDRVLDLQVMQEVQYLEWFDMADPNGRFLAFQISSIGYQLADLNSCQGSDCFSIPLAGRPQWSPSGNRTLLVEEPLHWSWLTEAEKLNISDYWQTPFYIGNEMGQNIVPVGNGAMLTWVDDETYLFVDKSDAATTTLMWGNLTSGEQKKLLSSIDLVQTPAVEQSFPPNRNPSLTIRQIQQNPTNPYDLLVYTSSSTYLADLHLFRVSLSDEGTATWTHILHTLRSEKGEWSPNGRYLALYQREGQIKPITIYDLSNMVPLQAYVLPYDFGNNQLWLPQEDNTDTNWFFTQHDGYFLFTQPHTDETIYLNAPYERCIDYEWLTEIP